MLHSIRLSIIGVSLWCGQFWPAGIHAQTNWQWVEKATLPEAVSNNAVTAAIVSGKPFVYSFGGIDTSKIWSGIHLRSFRYDVEMDQWDTIPDLPDTKGKIAAGASSIGNRIYIVGGYYVASNGSETSSKDIHIFNPGSNQYEADGARIPVHIDDHVQAVWRDSLLYVITGWHDSVPSIVVGGENMNLVQIYNPSTDSWSMGTPVPNNTNYKVFGGSGTIIGDTIIYVGGVKDSGSFDMVSVVRKGIIDPMQPENIAWTASWEPEARLYRSGASDYQGQPLWFGGADEGYNFDGIAYIGGQGVEPLNQVLRYDPVSGNFTKDSAVIRPVMDLRGVGKISETEFVIAGGMEAGQQVSNKCYLISDGTTAIHPLADPSSINIYPNPADRFLRINLKESPNMVDRVEVWSIHGQRQLIIENSSMEVSIPTDHFEPGMYILQITTGDQISMHKLQVIH